VPVIQAFVFLVAVVVVLANLIVDALYVWLDPRIRLA
jgi:ABC-type dipeptide/oligopeptide/nickel transport system permease component